MKTTNIRSEDLVERATYNDLNDEHKNIVIEMLKPSRYKYNPSPETVKKQNEWRRNTYRTDEEYRKIIELRRRNNITTRKTKN